MVQQADSARVTQLRASSGFAELYAELKQSIREHRACSAEPYILALDGRSGSGKTTLRQALAEQFEQDYPGDVSIFTLDDLYPGWDGLRAGVDAWIIQAALLSAGAPAPFKRWDWESSCTLHTEYYTPSPIILAEGVGSLAGSHSAGIWCVATSDTRRKRALERDGQTYEPHWQRWADQEAQLLEDFACIYAPYEQLARRLAPSVSCVFASQANAYSVRL